MSDENWNEDDWEEDDDWDDNPYDYSLDEVYGGEDDELWHDGWNVGYASGFDAGNNKRKQEIEALNREIAELKDKIGELEEELEMQNTEPTEPSHDWRDLD